MRSRILLVLFLVACTPAGPAPGVTDDRGPAVPRLDSRPISPAAERTARELLGEAQAASAAGLTAEAVDLTTRVVEEYPGSRVSVDALVLRVRLRSAPWADSVPVGTPEAEAAPEPADTLAADRVAFFPDEPVLARPAEPDSLEIAEDAAALVLEDVARLFQVLPGNDPRVSELRVVRARALAVSGQLAEALGAALALAPADSVAVEPVDRVWVTVAAIRTDREALGLELGRTSAGTPLRIPVLVAYARGLRIAGQDDAARRFAQSALDAGAVGEDAEVALALVEGRALPRAGSGPVPLGVVLPLGGSPAFQVFAAQLREGVEAAVEAWGLQEDVELLILDDGGDVLTAGNLVRAAESQGAVAVLGLLDDAALAAGTQSRSRVPLVSPTAYQVPDSLADVLSLNAFDPGAAEALAVWTAESGIQQVVVIHSVGGASAEEAQVFTETFESLGGSVLRSFAYPRGATFWETQLVGAAQLLPEAVVLAVPPEDVSGIAPQATFFGLDTLGIRIMGTGGFTDPQVLDDVDTRHTDGIVVATPVRPGPDSEGYRRFQDAYERRFRRGLADGAVQALGYDAASLVLQGIFAGAGVTEEISAALGQVTDFSGATGDLSVVDGTIRRRHQVVCLENRIQRPLVSGQLPILQYRLYPPDPETDSIPEGPGRPAGFDCPLPVDSTLLGSPLLGDTLAPADTLVGDILR